MKKGIIAIIVILVIAGGAYVLFHKSNKSTPAPTTAATSSTSQSATPTPNNAVFVTKTDPKLGQYLADPNGMPLYTYNADTAGTSNCTGSCLSNWPAYVATSTSNLPAGISVIKRTDDGKNQYAYNGMPLYYFTSDSAGKVTGNGVENFSVAKPMSASSSNTSSNSSSQSQPSSSSTSPAYNYPY